ncbi:3469_t:CDS:2, partial [Ambispora leptoticha]
DITSDDYFEKIMPYRKIIPEDIEIEILAYYLKNSTPQLIKLLPPRHSIDSNIINYECTNNWNDNVNIIKKKTWARFVNNTRNSYNVSVFSIDDKSVPEISCISSMSQITYQANGGPYFNNYLYISNNCDHNSLSWYKKDGLDDYEPCHFLVDEYEVFHIRNTSYNW